MHHTLSLLIGTVVMANIIVALSVLLLVPVPHLECLGV